MNENEALVFYCAGCGNLCVAMASESKWISINADEIAEELKRGSRMAIVPDQVVREQFKLCECEAEANA